MRRTFIAVLAFACLLSAQIVVVPKKKAPPAPKPSAPAKTVDKPGETLRYCSEFGYLRIALHPAKGLNPPAELLLADAQKKRLGNDPLRQADYSEIPRASYSSESQDDQAKKISGPKSRVIEVCSPQTGYYTLQVIGTAAGDYELDVQGSNREVLDSAGRPIMLDSRADISATTIRRGQTHTFTLYYSRTPGVKVRLRQNK